MKAINIGFMTEVTAPKSSTLDDININNILYQLNADITVGIKYGVIKTTEDVDAFKRRVIEAIKRHNESN